MFLLKAKCLGRVEPAAILRPGQDKVRAVVRADLLSPAQGYVSGQGRDACPHMNQTKDSVHICFFFFSGK